MGTRGPGAIAVVGDALLDRDLEGRADRLCPDAPAPVGLTCQPGGSPMV